MNWELVDAGLGLQLAEEVAVDEDGADDSSLLEGEPSFFMEVRKKHLNSCLLRLRLLTNHCFQIHLVEF